ncbi:hypothetical protein ABEG18_01535 [Alsobacter sp. KACC 23698]|uniref:DUF904 domain-containing protein n=1 Tax=Alsobacter sp. KACC 23698 TaxID=3149229 RepID=A0AAU7JGJ1_9HYPH
MDHSNEKSALEAQIAIVRANISDLIEQSAAYSGAGDEDRSATRIEEQQNLLTTLQKKLEDLDRRA